MMCLLYTAFAITDVLLNYVTYIRGLICKTFVGFGDLLYVATEFTSKQVFEQRPLFNKDHPNVMLAINLAS